MNSCLDVKNVLYLPSGRVFLSETEDNYLIESTEMRDVNIGGKIHSEVRNTNDTHIIWKHLVSFKDKWLLTVSTQKGCTYNCKFCDVANLPFKGNLSYPEIRNQIENILLSSPYVKECNKVKIGFARMGEPAHNLKTVLDVIEDLPLISNSYDRDFTWLPCFNSILPKETAFGDWRTVIDHVIDVKEKVYEGFLHFQISCNSTDEEKRKELFNGANVATIEEIIQYINNSKITNRTVTLNFIVMEGIEVSVDKLKKMNLDSNKFTAKLIPLNNTINAKENNNLNTYANYENYEKLVKLGNDFKRIGVPVVIDAIAKCEESGLCCGQLAQIFQ